jgi:prepilin-type N-terminal cleavage/methylation domain-containing protein
LEELTHPETNEKNGFTLIELLIAVAILSVAIIGIIALFPRGYSHIGTAGRISTMNHLGQQKLDQLRTLSYDDGNLMEGTHPSTGLPEVPVYLDSSGTNIYANYSIRWKVQDDTPQTGMKQVIVEVGHQYIDGAGNVIDEDKVLHQRVVYFQTYFSE